MSFFAGRDTRAVAGNDEGAARSSGLAWMRGGVRALVFPAVVAGLALLAAGCGGGKRGASVVSLGPTSSTTSAPSASRRQVVGAAGSGPQTRSGASGGGQFSVVGGGVEQLTKYAVCMRKNGVPDFPDPNAQGQISFSSGGGADPGSALFQQGQLACEKLLPNGGQPSPAQQLLAHRNALAFSACMRSHGVPNFPDPQFGSGGRVSIKITAGIGLDPRSPEFQSAQKACQTGLPGSPIGAPPGAAGSKASNEGSSSG